MAEAAKILRKTIHAFLRNYHSYATISALLVFPLSASILLSQAFVTSSPTVLHTVQFRIRSLFEAVGFPVSAGFFSLLNLKLSQTIFSLAYTVPFTLTFLVLAKAAIIQIVFQSQRHEQGPPSLMSFRHLYIPLVQTYIGNYITMLSINAAVFSFLFVAFNVVGILQISSSTSNTILSIAGGISYSIIIAQVTVACNLAIIISGYENQGGFLQILKAFLLIRGRTSTSLYLALSANIGMAATEALFQYRVVKEYFNASRLPSSTVGEAFTVTYVYSIFVVLDTIATCMFFKSCKLRNLPSWTSETYQQANKLLYRDQEYPESAYLKC